MSERGQGQGIGGVPVNVSVNVSRGALAPLEPATGSADPDQAPYSIGLSYGLWCASLAGACGIHRFYMGKIGTGILYFATFGLLGIGQIVDLFRMRSLVRNANIRDGRIPHPRLAEHGGGHGGPNAKLPPPDVLQLLLQAAMDNGGELTVTQGVMATGKGFEEVEKTLTKMSSRGYVDVDNAPGSGVVVYRFPELATRRKGLSP